MGVELGSGRKITHEYIQESATTIVTIFTHILGVVQPATDEFKILKAANASDLCDTILTQLPAGHFVLVNRA